ncbi:putative metalloprotease CJM1_0395 family protein [Sagittula stellata]
MEGSVGNEIHRAGWDAVAPLMAAYHQKIAEAREDSAGLSGPERKAVSELRARDREVRAHEQAHATVGGQFAGAPSYTYQTGPDGNRYAIGGEVPIDISPVEGDPEATIDKMDQVKAAALAPAEPSAADRQVAALADASRAQAVADLAALRSAGTGGSVDVTA